MKQLSTRLVIAVFFVIAFSFIGFFVVVTFKNLNRTKELNNQTNKSLHFLLITEKLLESADELSAAQRGYVFISKEEYSQQHNTAVNKLLLRIDSLHTFKKDNPDRIAEIEKATKLITAKINDSKNTIAIFDTAGIYAVVDKIKTGATKKINDNLRSSLQQMEQYDRMIINKSNQYLEDTAQKTSYRFLILAFAFLVILVAFLMLINFDFKRKEKTAAQLRYQASLIETLPDAIFTTNKHFVVDTWNKYAAELYGVDADEAKGKPLSEVISILNITETREASLAALQNTGYYKGEYLIRKKDNEIIYVIASINTILNNEGEITGYIAVHRNITERKKLEDSQREFNLELEKQVKIKTAETTNIMERITDGFLALDSNLTFINKKAGEILGHEPANMIGRNVFTGFEEISSSTFNEACAKAYKEQQYIFLENFYEPLCRWLENDIYPSEDGLSIFFKDVTFKKKTENALKESEERYRHLIENIHAGVVVHNPDGSILLYNQEAARLLGIKEDKKIPTAEWFSVSASDNKLTHEEYPALHVIRTGDPLINVTAGIDNPNSESRMWVIMNAFPEFDEEKKLKQVVLTFVDITNRKRAEEELTRSEENLNMAQAIAKTGSWEFNLLTKELKWSKELYRIYELEGVAPDQLYEKYRQRFHPEDLPSLD
ncbi:MAG: PAS domain S-box protein, partial [Bacteroidota bacterium]